MSGGADGLVGAIRSLSASCERESEPMHAGKVLSVKVHVPEKSGRVCGVACEPTKARAKAIAPIDPCISGLRPHCGMTPRVIRMGDVPGNSTHSRPHIDCPDQAC